MSIIEKVYSCVCEAPATCRDVSLEVFGDWDLKNIRKASAYLCTLAQRGDVRVFGSAEAVHWHEGRERGGRYMKIYEAAA